jgi:iron complex transport system permease protein
MPNNRRLLVMLCSFSALIVCLAPFVGSYSAVSGSPGSPGSVPDAGQIIFWHLRLPRVCLAFLSGAALSLGGLVFQALFRNQLATPFTLGVSSGAAFGAALFFILGASFSAYGFSGSAPCALIGALGTVALVQALAQSGRARSQVAVLLAGVVISFFFSSLIVFLQYISDFTGIVRMTRWLMGGFEVVGFDSPLKLFPFALLGFVYVFAKARELDLIAVDDEIALSRGVDVQKIQRNLYVITSLMVAGVVSLCGPIGFVDIIVPQICRILVGSGHRLLSVACVFFGGAFMVACDTAGRTIIAPYEMPAGIITALLGGPFFLWLLLRGNRLELT